MAARSPTTTTVSPHMQLPRVHPTGVHTLLLQRHFMSNGFFLPRASAHRLRGSSLILCKNQASPSHC